MYEEDIEQEELNAIAKMFRWDRDCQRACARATPRRGKPMVSQDGTFNHSYRHLPKRTELTDHYWEYY